MEKVVPNDIDICPICSMTCSKICSNCHKVSYCSVEHQKAHRKQHKEICYPAKIVRDQMKGRVVHATRFIQPGELIWKDKAMISAPNAATVMRLGYTGRSMCLGCYRLIAYASDGAYYECSRCGWPLCDENCEKKWWHANYECGVFEKAGVLPTGKPQDYDYIKVLRALLMKDNQPEEWERIMELEGHVEAREKIPMCKKQRYGAVMFIRTTCNLTQFEFQTINHLVGVFRVNGFGLHNWPSPNPGFREGSFLFYNSSMFAHDCVPNTKSYLLEEVKGHKSYYWKHVIATVPIYPGDPITKSYIESLKGTLERRVILNRGYHFGCTCARCSDQTEFGSYFSAIKCQTSKCTGYLLLRDPLNLKSDWACNKCNASSTTGELDFVMTEMDEDIKSVSTRTENSNLGPRERIAMLIGVLNKHQGKNVHVNHWQMVEVEYDILNRWRDALLDPTLDSDIKSDLRKMTRAITRITQHCLSIGNVLRPGLTIFRGCILLTLAYVFTITFVNELENGIELEKESKLSRLKELKSVAEEGRKIMMAQPEGSLEKNLAQILWPRIFELRM